MKKITSYDILKKTVRGRRLGLSFWRGFLSYELGYKFLGIHPREKKGQKVPEVYFESFNTVAPRHIEKNPFYSPSMVNKERRHQSVKTQASRVVLTPALAGLRRDTYFSKIQTIKEKLCSGETYQVNFSQPFSFSVPAAFSAHDFFQKLSTANPSPHEYFFENEDFAVMSNSPELLVKGYWVSTASGAGSSRKKFFVETRPIKGTMPRGRTPEEDEKQIQKLLASKKEEAELTMIVDLERNDVGKVCKPGTVTVKEHRTIEKYSHVIHTASVIQGELEEKKDVFDVLEAIFPGGSITGCPKKRTMEIIDELEEVRRGVYCGSAGYIAPDGSFEFNIMIRTAFLDKRKGILTFHSGGGIVIDSDPKKEYEETLHKAAAFFETITY